MSIQKRTWSETLKQLEHHKCKTCGGSGEVDDASPGDISYNMYKCKPCKGTGWKDPQLPFRLVN